MNIYISGLSYGINNADWTNLFAEFGGVEYDSKVISVSVARPREERPSMVASWWL